MVRLFVCSHLFCEECISVYVEGKLKLLEQFNCPSCSLPFDDNCIFLQELSVEEQEKLISINLRKQINSSNDKLRECPDEKCKLGVIRVRNDKQRTGTCEECYKQYCIRCMLPAHKGECANISTDLLQKKFNFKECPKCKRIIERISGCPHITCLCGKDFCYICLGDW